MQHAAVVGKKRSMVNKKIKSEQIHFSSGAFQSTIRLFNYLTHKIRHMIDDE